MSEAPVELHPEVADALESSGLRYTNDAGPGVRRRGSAPRFRYVDAKGGPVRDARLLARIRSLVLPPAWADVWISADPRGHLQATGRDARGRKQYRYHARWREERDSNKFDRLADFGRTLPAIRAAVKRDLALAGLPREKVLATVVALLDRTALRVGDERYRRENGSFGLTTLRNRHVEVNGEHIRIRFRGKSGKEHDIALSDRRLASVVRRCRDLPGYELFRYLDDGTLRSVDAADVNAYLRSTGGGDYTAKDFRTWSATVIAAAALMDGTPPATERDETRSVNQAVRCAAEVLGNTLAVCRKSYVHPRVLDCAHAAWIASRRKSRVAGLSLDERRTLALLAADAPREVTRTKRSPAAMATLAKRTPGPTAEARAAL